MTVIIWICYAILGAISVVFVWGFGWMCVGVYEATLAADHLDRMERLKAAEVSAQFQLEQVDPELAREFGAPE